MFSCDLYILFSVKRFKFVPKMPLSYFQPNLVAIFVANQINTRLLHYEFCSNRAIRRALCKATLFSGLIADGDGD